MPSEKYEFHGHEGNQLAGRLELPEGTPQAYAIFAHCFTCTKDFIASRNIARALADRRIATLRFDFTGLGNSQGDFANTDFSSNVADLVAAAKALTDTHDAPKIMIGHSLGGAATLAAARSVPSATAIATLAAPFDPSHVAHLFKDDLATITTKGKAKVDLFGRDFTITRQFIEDINEQHQRDNIATMRKALLVMHSPTDQTVGIDNAKMIYDAAMHPKSFVSLDGMDHLMTKPEDVAYAADILASWAARYIDHEPVPALDQPSRQESNGTVHLRTTGNGPFSLLMQAGPHTVLADEPLSVGGKNSGATPYDFLLMSVGSCTAMTLRMYARHKNLPLEDVKITLRHERVHVEDCDHCEADGEHYIHEIHRELQLIGDLTDDQRQRMLEIADKCPVHRTLEGKIIIETKLKRIPPERAKAA